MAKKLASTTTIMNLFSAILVSVTSIALGYEIGVLTGAIIFIKKDLNFTDIEMEILTQMEIIAGITNVYSVIGSFLACRISDRIGHRYTIVLAGAIFFTGALLMGFATNYAFFMAGRVVAGIGVQFALMIVQVYTAQVSPASTRGFLSSFRSGFLFGHISNYAFSKRPLYPGWRMMVGIGAVLLVFLALGVLSIPESKEAADKRLSEIKSAAGIPETSTDDIKSDCANEVYIVYPQTVGELGSTTTNMECIPKGSSQCTNVSSLNIENDIC